MTEVTCETQGHIYNSTGKCVMCDTQKPIEALTSKPMSDDNLKHLRKLCFELGAGQLVWALDELTQRRAADCREGTGHESMENDPGRMGAEGGSSRFTREEN